MRTITIAIVGAPSSIGLRPYAEGGEPRRLDLAPAALRDAGVVARLGAEDLGDVLPAPYRDVTRPPGGIRNEDDVERYSRSLAERVSLALGQGRFPLVLGGDCSIVLGTMLAATRHAGRVGLVYVDAHADFGSVEESLSGSAASMCLALTVGRGASPLARLAGSAPLVRAEDVVLIGRRDMAYPNYGHAALAISGILDLPEPAFSAMGPAAAAKLALERVARADVDRFWIHVDADVLDPRVMPAVDTPEAGGPGIDELVALVAPLADHPHALGLQITIYDPTLDPDRACAARLATLLERILANGADADIDIETDADGGER